MNKQKLNKVLILFLILIWGFVGYKFISNTGSTHSPVEMSKNSELAVHVTTILRDTIHINKLNRDPFLGTYIVKKKKSIKKAVRRKPKARKIISWPQVEYFGYVKNHNNKSPLVLLKINGQVKRIRKEDKLEVFRINSVYKDSIIISIGREKRTIKKN